MALGVARKLAWVGTLAAALWGATTARAATPEQVDAAIKKGVAFLYSQQNGQGNWEDGGKQDDVYRGGLTALATYGLLAAGEPPRDPRIQKGVNYLMKIQDMKCIYGIGMRAQVWQFLPLTESVQRAAKRDFDIFLKSCDQFGRYGYFAKINPGDNVGNIHNSPSQYGVLGMWACAEAGVGLEVPKDYWKKVETGWKICQGPDGGWRYQSVPPKPLAVRMMDPASEGATGTLTAAGIASLFITQDYLRASDGINCTGNITNPSLEAGLQWMAKNFDPTWSEGYFLYGVERIGVASGLKYFGKHDWYQSGSDLLVNGGFNSGYGPIPGTTWGILFLVRGRAPVVMNKLNYDITPEPPPPPPGTPAALAATNPATTPATTPATKPANKEPAPRGVEAPWNERPRDVANITRYISKKTENLLNWQIVNLESTPEALLEAPILYISGNKVLEFTADERGVLQRYVQRGGIILGHADGDSTAFASSFEHLMKRLFPNTTARELPIDHPIYTNQSLRRPRDMAWPSLTGWTNGVREVAFLFAHQDPAKQWQMRAHLADKAPFSEVMVDIFQYAVDKKPRVKGDTYLVQANPAVKDSTTITLARLAYKGNWDPEPGGWVQFGNILHNTKNLGLDVQAVPLGEDKLTAVDKKTKKPLYQFAHLTGTAAVKFEDKQLAEIKAFLDAGGMLIIDSAGGSSAFANSVSSEFARVELILPPPVLSETDPLINGGGVGVDCSKVSYRPWARLTTRKPRLRAQTTNNRKVIFFSEDDLSAGLVGNPIDGIKGYNPVWATNLMTNIMLYAAGKIKDPAAPATQP